MIELQLLEQYRSMFPGLVSIAVNSDLTSFKQQYECCGDNNVSIA